MKLSEWFKDWYREHQRQVIQGRLEQTLGVMLEQMRRAAEQISLLRLLPDANQKVDEAFTVLIRCVEALEKSLHLLTPESRKTELSDLHLIVAIAT